jgi:hypothetical protein
LSFISPGSSLLLEALELTDLQKQDMFAAATFQRIKQQERSLRK